MAMPLPDGPEKAVILDMTYGVVAFSIIVQGLTISRFIDADPLKGLLTSRRGFMVASVLSSRENTCRRRS